MPPASEPPPGPDDQPFQRLNRLTPLAYAGRALGLLVVFLVLGRAESASSGTGHSSGFVVTLIVFGALALITLARGVIDLAVTTYRLEPTDFRVDSGLLQRWSRRVRLDRLQSVDVIQPLTARVLGLAELRLATAGTESASLRLRYISLAQAQALRAELLGRAAGIGPGAAEAPERTLITVPPGTLVAGVLLQLVSWRLLLLLAGPALAYLGSRENTGPHPAATATAVGIFVYGLLVVAHFIWRRVTELWDFTVAESPDGVRIRRGLLATSAQTVPFDRVQALLVHQPFLFRPFGWAIVRMNVAGYVGRREAASTVLLPVAPRRYAEWLAGRVLGVELDSVPLTRPPTRAGLRAPIWWRAEAVGSDDHLFVSRHGVFSKSIDAVPHGRTQSVHVSAGPWQRALRLASVELDSTRGPVKIRARFRDQDEARRLVELLADQARLARQADGVPAHGSGGAPPSPAPRAEGLAG